MAAFYKAYRPDSESLILNKRVLNLTPISTTMKNLILTCIIAFSYLVTFSQDPIYVFVETEAQNGATLRTFYIEGNYCDRLIEQYTADYGAPTVAITGILKWSNVSLTGVGTNLTIECNDGVQIFDGSNWSHSTALNAADMEAKLYADPTRARRMYITVKKGNKNKIDSVEKEAIVVSTIEDIILAE